MGCFSKIFYVNSVNEYFYYMRGRAYGYTVFMAFFDLTVAFSCNNL